MTSARGDAVGGGGGVVRVDLDGFPTTWPVRQGRAVRWLWLAFAAFGLLQVIRQLTGEVDVVALALGSGQVVLSLLMVVLVGTARVQLEPEGYRLGDAVYRGRLRPWSALDHVRPGQSRWGTQAELRGRTASPAPVALHGMTDEQAMELQRRVVAARARGEVGAAEECA